MFLFFFFCKISKWEKFSFFSASTKRYFLCVQMDMAKKKYTEGIPGMFEIQMELNRKESITKKKKSKNFFIKNACRFALYARRNTPKRTLTLHNLIINLNLVFAGCCCCYYCFHPRTSSLAPHTITLVLI